MQMSMAVNHIFCTFSSKAFCFMKDIKSLVLLILYCTFLLQGSFPPQNVASSLSLQQAGLASSSSSSTSQQLPGVLMQNYTLWREEAGSVEEALFSLSTSLEDFRGQYNELQTLEEVVIALEAFVRVSECLAHIDSEKDIFVWVNCRRDG